MQYKFYIFILLFLFGKTSFSQQIWIERDSVNGADKASCIGFSLFGKGYIGLGRNNDGDRRSLYSYDIDQDDWDDQESLGGATGFGLERSSAISFTIGGKAYAGTGKSSTPFLDDMWQYDPIADTWTQKANFGGSARRQAVAFAIDFLGFVGTGEDATGLKKDFWKYNPTTNLWTPIAPFQGTPRKQAIGTSMGSKGYVGTGNDGAFTNDVWEYSPNSNTWLEIASFAGTPREGATAFAVFPQLFIATGYDNTLSYKKDIWEYNYWTQSWLQKPDLIGPERVNATAFVIDEVAYFGTGYNGSYLNDFYEYLFTVSTAVIKNNYYVNTYPNPSINIVTIETDITDNADLHIYNINGKEITLDLIINKTFNGVYSFKINTSTLSSNMYFYMIKNEKQHYYTGKITIVKN